MMAGHFESGRAFALGQVDPLWGAFRWALGMVLAAFWVSGAMGSEVASSMKKEQLTVGGGCFWCVEAVFERRPGVLAAVSGYAGGKEANPTYEQVCSGRTGHAEVVQVTFDPEKVRVGELLDLFFLAHDPTTLNRQGADVGPQYRSIILYADEGQKAEAEAAVARAQAGWNRPVVTQVVPLERFYPAEDYHQDYFERNPNAGYCAWVIRPKLEKLEKKGAIPGR